MLPKSLELTKCYNRCKVCANPNHAAIEAALLNRDITQAAAAKMIGCSKNTIAKHLREHYVPNQNIITTTKVILSYERLKSMVEEDLNNLDKINYEVLTLLQNAEPDMQIQYISGLSSIIEQRRKYIETATKLITTIDTSKYDPNKSPINVLEVKFIESSDNNDSK